MCSAFIEKLFVLTTTIRPSVVPTSLAESDTGFTTTARVPATTLARYKVPRESLTATMEAVSATDIRDTGMAPDIVDTGMATDIMDTAKATNIRATDIRATDIRDTVITDTATTVTGTTADDRLERRKEKQLPVLRTQWLHHR